MEISERNLFKIFSLNFPNGQVNHKNMIQDICTPSLCLNTGTSEYGAAVLSTRRVFSF
jgi:hypothetical protein